jgi:hypothetical protein
MSEESLRLINQVINRLEAWRDDAHDKARRLPDREAQPFVNTMYNYDHLVSLLELAKNRG